MRFSQLIDRHQVLGSGASLEDIPLDMFDTAPCADLRRRISMTLARRWLCSIPDMVDTLPHARIGYVARRCGDAISVSQGAKTVASYDLAFLYDQSPVVAKVKSLKLRGALDDMPSQLQVAQDIYGLDVRLLIFAPMYGKWPHDVPERIHLCDLGYTGGELQQMEQRILQQRS